MVALEQLIVPPFFFILFIFLLQKWQSGIDNGKSRPPSPRKLPIIGNLHQLGTSPHRSLQSLSKRYGHLMLLHFGRTPVLVASSAEAAHEIMKAQDVTFSNRPRLSIPNRLLYGSRNVGFSPYGEYWRQVRSICVGQLLTKKRVQSFRCVREEETSAMVGKIRQSGSSLSDINLSNALISLTNNIVCRVALGRKCSDDEKDPRYFKRLLGDFMELLGTTTFGDCISWLSWIDRVDGLDAKVEKVAKEFDEFLETALQEHKNGEKRDDGDGKFDFVDVLLEFQSENESGSPVEDDTIKALILDMFAAGTDTTASTLEWTIAELIKNPRTMKILQTELRQVLAENKDIDEDDLEKMQYLKAVIKESLRLHPPAPLLVPRESSQDTKVMGYDIKAGTRVLINAWAIARDPSMWENPEEFRPERFLDSTVDFGGLHFEYIPFGAGRRSCPGISFTMAIVELALAKLAYTFNFALPNRERGEDLDMKETVGISVHKKLPLLVVTTSHIC